MSTSVMRPDGSCPACIGGWLCVFHQQENARRDRERAKVFRAAAVGIRTNRIAELCARHEIESDEGGNREDKAARMLGAQSFAEYVS